MSRPIAPFWGAALFLLIGLPGCGRAPEYTGAKRFPIAGTVTYEGELISGGTIALIPEDGKSNPAGGPIENGKYSVPDVKGPNAGSYRVQVYWYKPTGKKIKDPDTGAEIDEVKQVIPAKFNDTTTLTTSIDGPREDLNFDIK